MFRCVRAPMEPQYPTDLATFGYHKTEKGEFVNTATGKYFDYFHTNNERVNDIRRGAYQEALRKEVAAELKLKHGITELYLSGKDGTDVTFSRPQMQHVSLLTTEVSELPSKRDVVVVVGEASQDCGIWAWRIVQREGGMEGGSLVGLVKNLATRGEKSVAQLNLEDEPCAGTEHSEEIPGIVVLNPGQLLYSHDMQRNVSRATWLSRPRPTATSEPYKLDVHWNSIPGHTVPGEHVKTVLDKVLPNLISSTARLHIVTIGDGSAPMINFLDNKLLNIPSLNLTDGGGAGILTSAVLIDSTHEHDKIASEHLKLFLASHAKSWVQNETVKNTKLQVPEGFLLGPPAIVVAGDYPAASALDDAVSLSNGGGNTSNTPIPPPASTTTTTSTAPAVRNTRSDSVNGHVDFIAPPPRDDDVSPTPVPPNTPAASLPTSPDPTIKPETPLAISTEQSENDEEKGTEEGEDDDYPPPTPLSVSCPTYSAGVCDGITETVFPRVLEDVLDFLDL